MFSVNILSIFGIGLHKLRTHLMMMFCVDAEMGVHWERKKEKNLKGREVTTTKKNDTQYSTNGIQHLPLLQKVASFMICAYGSSNTKSTEHFPSVNLMNMHTLHKFIVYNLYGNGLFKARRNVFFFANAASTEKLITKRLLIPIIQMGGKTKIINMIIVSMKFIWNHLCVCVRASEVGRFGQLLISLLFNSVQLWLSIFDVFFCCCSLAMED